MNPQKVVNAVVVCFHQQQSNNLKNLSIFEKNFNQTKFLSS